MSKPKIENKVAPIATQAPDQAPDPVDIKKDSSEKMRRKRNPLRIDMPSSSAGSGVNI